MSMNQIPTLVIGIGGIGCRIAGVVSDNLSVEDRKYVSVIGVDTNKNDLTTIKEQHRMEVVQTSDEIKVYEYLEKHPEYRTWFPNNDFLKLRTMTDGAGQIRTLSRLAFLESVEAERFNIIKNEITRIRKIDSNPNNGTLAVVIVGSITGGTGAGLFMSMPFYIRKLAKQENGLNKLVVRGMFVGSDITEGVQPSKTNKDAVCVNGYACLKELNAFYMRPVMNSSLGNNLRLEFYDHNRTEIDEVPYNYLYLVEKSSNLGTMGDARLPEVIDYIGHVLFTLMFSPVTKNAISIEDNLILEAISKAAMNRYTGAGMCRLIYPEETIKEYVTLATVRDQVKKEWLLIDQEFNARAKVALAKMATDRTASKPELKTEYLDIFKEAVLGDHAKLGMLAKEAYDEKNFQYISKGNNFIAELDRMVEELLESDEVLEKEEGCRFDDQKMKNFSDAAGQINNVWEGMRDYSRFAKHMIDTKTNGFADAMFPTSSEVMEFHKDKPECIYGFLAKVHPVTARFLIYDIIRSLEAKIADLKPRIAGVDLSAYKEEDFDPKQAGVQGPAEYLGTIRDKRNPIWKMLGPLGQAINGEEKALRKLKRRLSEVCETHISSTREFLENSLKLQVAELVLERLVQLADNYTIFFNTVAAKIEKNNDNISRLEDLHFPYGQEGIYCSKEALQKIAVEYSLQHPMELSEKTKQAIFEQIYLVQARAYSLEASGESKAAKEKRNRDNKRRLENVFNTAVVKTVRSEVNEHGEGIVNLTARSALIKEFEMKAQMLPDDEGYSEKLQDYVKDRINTAFKVAVPMITTENGSSKTEITFLAVSSPCAINGSNSNPDESETGKFYLPSAYSNAMVIINDEFSDNEFTCIRLSYNYTIEDLTKYKAGTRNANAYMDRILNLEVRHNLKTSLDSDGLTITVNPHLDANWDQEAFIPAIDKKTRVKDHIDVLKAFIYGIGFDYFRLLKDDEHPDDNGRPRPTWFDYTNLTHSKAIKKCGRLIGNGYSDVFDSIPYNRTMKLAILKEAMKRIEIIKGYNTSEELLLTITENSFVEDLIQLDGPGEEGEKNIFDIFAEMRTHMPEDAWQELFDGLMVTLWEFCEILFDKNEVLINRAMKKILEEIYSACKVNRAPETCSDIEKQKLVNSYNNLLKRKYGEE